MSIPLSPEDVARLEGRPCDRYNFHPEDRNADGSGDWVMNEAYVTGRSAHDALIALRDVVRAGETEPIIDMYERAAWMSGASHADTTSVIRVARKEKSQ